jgi:methyl-accepting chemotaxis protein
MRQAAAYGSEHGKLLALVRDGKKEQAQVLLKGSTQHIFDLLNSQLDKLLAHHMDGSQQAARSADDLLEGSRTGTLSLLGMALAGGALLAIWLARSISAPLQQVMAVAQRIAGGDLGTHINVTTKNETGRLLQAMQDMNDSLLSIIGQVYNGAIAIGAAAEQMASNRRLHCKRPPLRWNS